MWRVLWVVWIGVIVLLGILPLGNFVGHSHWQYIRWFPRDHEWFSLRLLRDLGANVLLYFPLGFFAAGRSPRRGEILRLVLLAAALSAGVELYQVYCHNRHPSPLDVAVNVFGALAGRMAGDYFLGRRRAGARS